MNGSYGFGVALFLAAYSYFSIIALLGPSWQFSDPIVAGLVTGLVTGNPILGLAIGGTLELMSLGLWTYGGATIPDFMTGAIVGTAVGALSKQPLSVAITEGITIAVPVSLFMTQLDILGRATTTIFIHGADRYAEQQNERGVSLMHGLGNIPWGLSRAVPIFFAIWLGAAPIQSLMAKIPTWLTAGLTTMGHMLPALGFGILLTYLPLRKWWPFFLLGFVLFGYLNMPLIGITIAALAIVIIYNSLTSKEEVPAEATEKAKQPEKATAKEPAKSNVTRGDLVNAMWRHNMTLQLSWNYERMQALGFCWSIMPVLKKVYTNKDDYFSAIKRHLNFYNTNPSLGSPTIFGAACALEEQKQPQAADDIKVALMGPFAGIGDTIEAILLKPIFAVFAAGMALNGNWFGAILMLILGLIYFYVMFPGFWLGYNQGMNLVKTAGSKALTTFSNLASIAALIIMGGFIPSILASVKTPIQFTRNLTVEGKAVQQVVNVQSILDKILPYMIPLALVFFVYWLLKSRRWTIIRVLLLIVVIAIILGALKILS
jgi:mannose/fructose/N-acetylgalactosamine-specific phosphotransferase system component IID/mannose/fructose/N-acetylgalactosamine-specific phosphotransferase system component IIC